VRLVTYRAKGDANTAQRDYEIELAAVIVKRPKSVAKEQAMEYVAGYTIMNDVGARDLQLGKDGGIILGKNVDQFQTLLVLPAGCLPRFDIAEEWPLSVARRGQ
jgi:2-keto-4-pentenoate hydratase/2-oxohepta-3-ene-1,7-dioic acid hydratase in catechol pathway